MLGSIIGRRRLSLRFPSIIEPTIRCRRRIPTRNLGFRFAELRSGGGESSIGEPVADDEDRPGTG